MSTTLVIDGHPNPNSFCAALARAYVEGNADARLLALRDLDFDVHLRHGYTRRMEMEPDLADAREAIRAAKHLVVVTPVWWRSVPALLKGFFDRALLPKQDYRYTKRGVPVGLLTGRSARLIVTADTPLPLQRFMAGSRLTSVAKGVLAFCGFKPVRVTRFAPVGRASGQRRDAWLEKVRELGARDAARVATRLKGIGHGTRGRAAAESSVAADSV